MTKRDVEVRDTRESLWDDAITLSADDTKDSKVHISLRLDPSIYRSILKIKRSAEDRTITATIERLLHRALDGVHGGIDGSTDASDSLQLAIRNLAAHSLLQDRVIHAIVSNVKLPAKDKRLFSILDACTLDSDIVSLLDLASGGKFDSKTAIAAGSSKPKRL